MTAALAAGREARTEVLARHGLDEASWETIDAQWQERLSEALDADDEDGVPALVAAYAAVYEQAQRELTSIMSLEQFAELTRLLQASGDVHASLAKVGVELGDYVRASAHWSGRMAEDPAIEQRFDEVVRGRAANTLCWKPR